MIVARRAALARPHDGVAWVGGRLATDLKDVTTDPAALDSAGFWVVVATFEGELTCARFAAVRSAPAPTGRWHGPPITAWQTSLDKRQYVGAVEEVRSSIAAGDVYQVNVCRVLSAVVDDAAEPAGLLSELAAGNPAPYAALVDIPGRVRLVSASPELYLRRERSVVESGAGFAGGTTARIARRA